MQTCKMVKKIYAHASFTSFFFIQIKDTLFYFLKAIASKSKLGLTFNNNRKAAHQTRVQQERKVKQSKHFYSSMLLTTRTIIFHDESALNRSVLMEKPVVNRTTALQTSTLQSCRCFGLWAGKQPEWTDRWNSLCSDSASSGS